MKLSFDTELERDTLIATLESYIVQQHFKNDVLIVIKIDEVRVRLTGFFVIFRARDSRNSSFITYGKHVYWTCLHVFIESVKQKAKQCPPLIDEN